MIQKTNLLTDKVFNLIMSTYPELEFIIKRIYEEIGQQIPVHNIACPLLEDTTLKKPAIDDGGNLDTMRLEIDSQFFVVYEDSIQMLTKRDSVEENLEAFPEVKYLVETRVYYNEWKGKWRDINIWIYE